MTREATRRGGGGDRASETQRCGDFLQLEIEIHRSFRSPGFHIDIKRGRRICPIPILMTVQSRTLRVLRSPVLDSNWSGREFYIIIVPTYHVTYEYDVRVRVRTLYHFDPWDVGCSRLTCSLSLSFLLQLNLQSEHENGFSSECCVFW